MSVIEYDVIVIGAGVSGLTAGTLLAKHGLNVALVTTGEPVSYTHLTLPTIYPV